jgi:hypothetical protein
MLTPADFTPASVLDLTIIKPLTNRKALANLVYRSDAYKENVGFYGDVYSRVKAAVDAGVAALEVAEGDRDDAQLEAIAVAQVLAAVAYRLNRTPKIAVESEGSEQRRSFFSSRVNWEELALDVLDNLFLPIGSSGSVTDNAFTVADRRLLDWNCTQTADEAMMTMRGWGYRRYIIGKIGGY